ncbi:MAG: low specificity L-threonine aldolase [Phycisphaerales bacterium]
MAHTTTSGTPAGANGRLAARVIDLRSDTVTRPTPAMRRAMAEAEVGDDVLGDDPTVIALQERVAAIMGKEAACFVPSGTMANQTAIRAQTEPGDGVIAHRDSHINHYETGAPAALSGVSVNMAEGARGMFDADAIDALSYPDAHHFPRTRLVLIENTQNRGGGAIWPMEQIRRVAAKARAKGFRLHLDGARVWNACAATGIEPRDYAALFDTVSCCFSKGLGAPAGSAVCGDRTTIARVHRFRKMFGGTMRQSGVLAAAALHALEHHRERLTDDHANAARLAEGLAKIPGVTIGLKVETNMVFIDLAEPLPPAAAACDLLRARGVWCLPTLPRRIRMVTHLDVSGADIDAAIDIVGEVLGAARVGSAPAAAAPVR